MELKIKLDYNQILGLIHQLPEQEMNKLVDTLNSEKTFKKSSLSIQKLILKAPSWTDSDMNSFTEARNHFSNSRLA